MRIIDTLKTDITKKTFLNIVQMQDGTTIYQVTAPGLQIHCKDKNKSIENYHGVLMDGYKKQMVEELATGGCAITGGKGLYTVLELAFGRNYYINRTEAVYRDEEGVMVYSIDELEDRGIPVYKPHLFKM